MTDRVTLAVVETYDRFRTGVVGTLVGVDVIRATGPGARAYLQTQLSQDLDGVGLAGSAESLVLSPQGKIEAYVTVVLAGEEEVLVAVAPGYGQDLLDRLKRFKIRVKAELALESWHRAVLRGPLAAATTSGDERHGREAVYRVPIEWPGMVGVDLLSRAIELPAGVEEGDPGAFEALRIEAGQPVMGREITERSIAQETGLVKRTVSFTKGCYPGQELVARIDARGDNVPRRLRGVLIPGAVDPELSGLLASGAPITVEGREVGSVTSAAWSPRLDAVVALGYVQRGVVPPSEAIVVPGPQAGLMARIVELPIASD